MFQTEMKIQGEELNGVYGANTLLEIGNHPSYIGKKCCNYRWRKCCNGCSKNDK